MNAYDKTSMVFLPHFRKAGKAYALKPSNGNGDLTVDRNCPAFEIDKNGKLKLVAANVPRFNHAVLGGCPKLLQEPEGTNLHEQPISTAHSAWVKENSVVEGDPSTAGVEIIINPPNNYGDGWSDNGDGTFSCDGTQTTNSFLRFPITPQPTNTLFKFEATVSATSAGGVNAEFGNNSQILGGYVGNGAYSKHTQAEGSFSDYLYFRADANFIGTVNTPSLKIIQGFSSPCVDFPNHAFKFIDNTVNGSHSLNPQNIVTIAASDYVNMVCAQKLEHTWIALAFDNLANSFAWFDLDNGVIGTVEANVTAKMIEIADGFYICSIKANVPSTNNVPEFYLSDADNSVSFAGNGTDGVLLFLADFKQSSIFMLPVYDGVDGASITRLKDIFSCDDLQTSQILGLDEGTIILDLDTTNAAGSSNAIKFMDATTLRQLALHQINDGSYKWYSYASVGDLSGNISSGSKTAIAWDSTGYVIYVDGAEFASGIFTPTAPITKMQHIDDQYGGAWEYSQIDMYTTRLPNADIANLTS